MFTLSDVFPQLFPDNDKQIEVMMLGAAEELAASRDAEYDDAIYLALLNRYIEVFTKAKSMLLRGRFRVCYIGDKHSTPTLDDFRLIV